ncbi:MFS transporter [Marinomonas aquiplantarum]|uniref:PPP family 3-phenylpropionic acid transporter n=1 Tax=Marinomonas aquiplantarum TaxID=491951 RepID=A0A366CY38_9GAMM|nr:MFS transporter [Marinomonas aquiplantarum]RBO82752.1 PPP family 3-phenylpropionic acid transporter [Marinomonas aquiplantarum]
MFSPKARSVAWPLFFFYFFFCCLIGVMMPYISVYYKSIGLSASEIGRLMSTFTLSGIVIPHFWGWLTAKIGLPKRILQCAVIGCFIAVLPFNWNKEFESLWLLTCCMALFYSALLPMTDSLAVRSIRRLDVPYTRLRVGGSIGYVVAVAAGGFLIGQFGAWIVIPTMCAFLALAVVTIFFVKEQAYEASNHKEPASFASLLKEPESLLFFGLAFLAFMSHAPFNVFFAVHLSDFGYSGEAIGLLMAFGVIIEIILFLFFGNTVKRFDVVHLVMLCFVCGVVRWLLVGWFTSNVWILMFTQMLHCITFALFHMVSIEQIRRLFPERYAGQGQAMYSAFAIGLGGGLGMVVTGYLWEWVGGAWAFTAAAIVSGLALIILIVSQKGR